MGVWRGISYGMYENVSKAFGLLICVCTNNPQYLPPYVFLPWSPREYCWQCLCNYHGTATLSPQHPPMLFTSQEALCIREIINVSILSHDEISIHNMNWISFMSNTFLECCHNMNRISFMSNTFLECCHNMNWISFMSNPFLECWQ